MRGEGEELVAELMRLVGTSSAAWRPVEPKRAAVRPPAPRSRDGGSFP